MAFRGMLLHQKLLFSAFILAATAAAQPDSSCNKTCGNLSIPYPFGTTKGCYHDSSSFITCNDTSGTPTPFLREGIRVNRKNSQFTITLSKFTVSYTRNKLTAFGCDTYAYISEEVIM
ncbi:hypothetical protein FH972_020479 [Carpinus fangiana]|uniref:Wall-associated receptor kinase galacturonan-binding domain-containing protein n=1 Tax=Carpinus fangiana TaxID=176857 RepID=A0A5N6RXR4_9ROSI|nr:hypothetical protein FH972_020479 [Carpinus fangiana]